MNNSQKYPAALQSLPITPYLDEICAALASSPSHFLVLTAETAAGKSTAVPLALLSHFEKNIFMLEPRRLATLAVASRVAELLGEQLGETAGYLMHLESRLSHRTRFTVMTEAVLTRKLQEDPSLDGVTVVVIDEFHERSIHADLALAFLKETMQIRNDLFVIVMSATIDTEQLSAYLGTDEQPAPVFSVPGRQFPVRLEYAGDISPADAVMKELHRSSSAATKQTQKNALPSHPDANGTILVFLPGIADIRRTASELSARATNGEILVLHSSISFDEQKKVLAPPLPGAKRRIILSSSIAETSLTVPGVTVVIDCGLARINRMNIAAGMETLVTERESVFSAQQRCGRAGRTAPGRCVRLWNESDARTSRLPPEILRTDLVPLVLECAQWGAADPSSLSWLDCPSQASWNSARDLLVLLGCLAQSKNNPHDFQITPLGKAALTLGVHPRLACVALSCISFTQETTHHTTNNALLRKSVACALRYSQYADSAPSVQQHFTDDLISRINTCNFPYRTPTDSTAVPLLFGFPDRLAHLIDQTGVYQFPSGRVASLPKNERQNTSGFSEWIIAPEADAGEREGRIYKYEPVVTKDAESWLAGKTKTQTTVEFIDSTHKIRKTESVCYGKIILSTKKIIADQKDFSAAVCNAVEKYGISWLPQSDRITDFLLRATFYELHQIKNTAEKTESIVLPKTQQLTTTVNDWLTPFLTGTTVTEDAVYESLRYYLDGTTVDKNVPARIAMPNGKSYRLSYEKQTNTDESATVIRPTLEIIIQQIFGCFETPRVMGVPVLLKLLSPARRPLQITDDLAGFWKNTWPEVCKEMKGRYPKHNWDYRIISPDN